jgi:hypothetical protein
MELEKQLLEIERKLWTNDATFYKSHLIDESLLVFPETGVITRSIAVDAIFAENAQGLRWAEVQFDDVRSLQLVCPKVNWTPSSTSRSPGTWTTPSGSPRSSRWRAWPASRCGRSGISSSRSRDAQMPRGDWVEYDRGVWEQRFNHLEDILRELKEERKTHGHEDFRESSSQKSREVY